MKTRLMMILTALLLAGGALWAQPADAPIDASSDAPTTAPAAAPTTQKASTSAGEEFMAKIYSAGTVGAVIIGLSVIGFAFAIERAANLRRSKVCPPGLSDQVLKHLTAHEYDQAAQVCRDNPSALGRVLGSIVRHRRFAFTDVSQAASDIATREMGQHLQRAYPMAIVATLSPLLGLLGTVIGMIGSFEAVALAGSLGDPSIMASEISYALVTTAMGLVVAVPSLAAYHFFRTRTNSLTALLDEQVSEVISEWQIQEMERTHAPRADRIGSPLIEKPATNNDTPNAVVPGGH